jgi:hypothetical protein
MMAPVVPRPKRCMGAISAFWVLSRRIFTIVFYCCIFVSHSLRNVILLVSCSPLFRLLTTIRSFKYMSPGITEIPAGLHTTRTYEDVAIDTELSLCRAKVTVVIDNLRTFSSS